LRDTGSLFLACARAGLFGLVVGQSHGDEPALNPLAFRLHKRLPFAWPAGLGQLGELRENVDRGAIRVVERKGASIVTNQDMSLMSAHVSDAGGLA